MIELTRKDIERILDWASTHDFELGLLDSDNEIIKKLKANLLTEEDLNFNGIKRIQSVTIGNDPTFVEVQMLNGKEVRFTEDEYSKFLYTLRSKSDVRDDIINKVL